MDKDYSAFSRWLRLLTAGMFLGLAVVNSLAAETTQPAAAKPLNVLFIAVDDLRPQLHCYGQEQMITPSMDKLASQGLLFTRAYCQEALCAPSRASLLSGYRPDTTRIHTLKPTLATTLPEAVTLPRLFRTHGYKTTSIGKIFHHEPGDAPQAWDNVLLNNLVTWDTYRDEAVDELRKKLCQENGTTASYKTVRGPAYYASEKSDDEQPDGEIALCAIDSLHQLKKSGSPFFLAVGFLKPHLAFTAPRKYFDLYDPAKLNLAGNPLFPEGAPSLAFQDSIELRAYYGIPRKGPIDETEQRRLLQAYYACATFVDAQIGRVLDELDRTGMRDNTIVILWGDHGWHLGEQGMWGKITNFENAVRAPLIISVPDQKTTGSQTDALTEFVDVYPTLAELCGLPLPSRLEGDSFVPLIKNPRIPWKKAAFSQHLNGEKAMGYTMRTARYRYTEWQSRGKTLAVELYDHETDPKESVNIADIPAKREIVAELARQLKAGWREARPGTTRQ